ncbi:MAG: hypothetical protein Q8930_11540 [Bacillota bacterium]|nr:hypothetical protein [Bacillota bacterium]
MSFNTYWYLGLAVFSSLLLIFICSQRGIVDSLLQFLIMAECAYLIEAVIYIFLGSYLYHPKIINYNAYYDSHMGALTSNLFVIPGLAALIATFDLGIIWILLIIGVLAMIEFLFIKLNIYTQIWWKISYTSAGLLLYFPLTKIVYKQILHPLRGFKHSLFLFLCIGPIIGTLHFLPVILFSSRTYSVGWYKDISYDTSAFGVLFYICSTVLQVLMVKISWKRKWIKYILVTLILAVANILLKEAGILHSQIWWDLWFYCLFPALVLRITESISNRLSNGAEPER